MPVLLGGWPERGDNSTSSFATDLGSANLAASFTAVKLACVEGEQGEGRQVTEIQHAALSGIKQRTTQWIPGEQSASELAPAPL